MRTPYNFRNGLNNYRNEPYFWWNNKFENNYYRPRLMNPSTNKEEKYGHQKSNNYDRLMELMKKKEEEENKRFENEIELAKKISLQEAEYKEAIEKSKKIAKEKEKKEKEKEKENNNVIDNIENYDLSENFQKIEDINSFHRTKEPEKTQTGNNKESTNLINNKKINKEIEITKKEEFSTEPKILGQKLKETPKILPYRDRPKPEKKEDEKPKSSKIVNNNDNSNNEMNKKSVKNYENNIKITPGNDSNINVLKKQNNNSKINRSQSMVKKDESLTYVPLSNPIGHNACYINSSIHLLFHCEDLSDFILQRKLSDIISFNIPYSLYKLFNEYSSKSKLKSLFTKENISFQNPLDTEYFRNNLSAYSNNRFPKFTMGDPVELIIFLLENICKIDSDFIHKLFYIDLSEVYVCGKCSNKVTLNYDKDHFVMEIYIKEILNYINLTKMDFQLFNNRLLSIENEISTQTQKKCEKCQNLMDEKRLCNYVPKYFLFNIVWNNKNPDKESIIIVYSLIQFSFKASNIYQVQNDKNYNFFGMILYCYYMAHYIYVFYDYNNNNFILYNDEIISKFKNYKELSDYLTGKDNKDKYIFYPVFLVCKESLNEKNLNLEMDKQYFDKLMGKIKANDNSDKSLNDKNNENKNLNTTILEQMNNKTEKYYNNEINSYKSNTGRINNFLIDKNQRNSNDSNWFNQTNKRNPSIDMSNLNKSKISLAGQNSDYLKYSNNLSNYSYKKQFFETSKYNERPATDYYSNYYNPRRNNYYDNNYSYKPYYNKNDYNFYNNYMNDDYNGNYFNFLRTKYQY